MTVTDDTALIDDKRRLRPAREVAGVERGPW
jgi:hypothetical protein